MGIRFIDSILTVLAAAMAIFGAYLIGHALSSDHAAWAWITAPVLLVAAIAIGFFTARRLRAYARERGETLHG